MKCEAICKKIVTFSFLGIITAFLLLVLSQFFIKNVLVEVFNMDNAVTNLLVTGKSDGYVDVDYEALYPFKEEVVTENVASSSNIIADKVGHVVDIIEKYSNDYLPFKEALKVPSGLFDKLIDNKMVDTDNIYFKTQASGLLVRSPFNLEYSDDLTDTTALADSVLTFSEYLSERGIDFLYVQSPLKEDCYDEEYIVKYGLSLENRLASNLIADLNERGIDTLDLRANLHDDGIACADSFFNTDNHWNIKTALWATNVISDKLNSDYGFDFDLNYFNLDNYDENIYENWLQGTIGRSVTLVNAPYDDISVYVPKFETNLTMKIPSLNMDKTGSFLETMVNPVPFERRSTVYHGAYDAFAYSKPPITEVTNNLENTNTKKILLLRESFAGPVITYMSLGVKNLYAITPEGFSGSIESYIEEVEPDMVVILYTAPTTNEITSKYDFK